MTGNIEFVIPPSTLDWLEQVDPDRPVVALLRHSVRDGLPPGRKGYALPITPVGEALARDLGKRIGRRLRSLHSSPLPRCRQTAEKIREGAQRPLEIHANRLLGDPGAFVLDSARAEAYWRQRGHEWVMERLVTDPEALPGLAAPHEAARFLVHHMLAATNGEPGVHVFVTHDSLVTATAAWMLGERLGLTGWPWYLEAAWFWADGRGTHAAYRAHHQVTEGSQRVGLSEPDVIEFARREVAATVGLDCPARFFLAGGAFKTLLTGRPPRDLDFWAPTPRDREALERVLVEKGATPLEPKPYTDTFSLNGRTVELPHKAEPPTLEERLGRFDIALSAVGVEYAPGENFRAVIHPLAGESARREEVLLLTPLVNWRHCLTTLERLRRYRDELGFVLDPAQEAEIWKVFDSQTSDIQVGMLERLARGSQADLGVREEALCRLR